MAAITKAVFGGDVVVEKVIGKRQANGKINLSNENASLRSAVVELQEREKAKDPAWVPKYGIAQAEKVVK